LRRDAPPRFHSASINETLSFSGRQIFTGKDDKKVFVSILKKMEKKIGIFCFGG